MSGFLLRPAGADDIEDVLAFWRTSAEDTDRRDDRPAVERLLARALLAAAEQRGAAEGAHRIDAMVLEENVLGQSAWSALGYAPQPEWRRWVKPLTPPSR